jgi:hypothetical protein
MVCDAMCGVMRIGFDEMSMPFMGSRTIIRKTRIWWYF